MTLRDSVTYLAGSKRAIFALASSRWTLLAGFVLVLTASLARNYDGAYLLREPEVLTHGIVISALNALLVYAVFYAAATLKDPSEPAPIRPPFFSGYLSFLGLFWMTAPMAWLYAIPYERFLSPVGAVTANAWTLAFVSVWRVALTTRVMAILWNASVMRSFFLVMLFADAVLFAAVWFAPVPVIDIMGGLHLSPEDNALAGLNFKTGLFAAATGPIWLIGAIVAFNGFKGSWTAPSARVTGVPRGLLVAALVALAAWLGVLPLTQPEQARRYRAESLLRGESVDEGLAFLSAHARRDFPPIWDPPPRRGYLETKPSMDQVRRALAKGGQAPWVRAIFLDKSWKAARTEHSLDADRPGEIEARGEDAYAALQHCDREALRFHLNHDERFSEADRVVLRRVLGEPEPNPR